MYEHELTYQVWNDKTKRINDQTLVKLKIESDIIEYWLRINLIKKQITLSELLNLKLN